MITALFIMGNFDEPKTPSPSSNTFAINVYVFGFISLAYGEAFDHFFISEVWRMNSYTRSDYNLYQYHTTAGGEVDLVLKRGEEIIAIEIKSSIQIDEKLVLKLQKTAAALQPTKIFYISQDPATRSIQTVECMHWRQFLDNFFAKP